MLRSWSTTNILPQKESRGNLPQIKGQTNCIPIINSAQLIIKGHCSINISINIALWKMYCDAVVLRVFGIGT